MTGESATPVLALSRDGTEQRFGLITGLNGSMTIPQRSLCCEDSGQDRTLGEAREQHKSWF